MKQFVFLKCLSALSQPIPFSKKLRHLKIVKVGISVPIDFCQYGRRLLVGRRKQLVQEVLGIIDPLENLATIICSHNTQPYHASSWLACSQSGLCPPWSGLAIPCFTAFSTIGCKIRLGTWAA